MAKIIGKGTKGTFQKQEENMIYLKDPKIAGHSGVFLSSIGCHCWLDVWARKANTTIRASRFMATALRQSCQNPHIISIRCGCHGVVWQLPLACHQSRGNSDVQSSESNNIVCMVIFNLCENNSLFIYGGNELVTQQSRYTRSVQKI